MNLNFTGEQLRLLLRVLRSGLASTQPKIPTLDQIAFRRDLTTAERTLAAIIEGGPARELTAVEAGATSGAITRDDLDVMLATSRAAIRGVDKLPVTRDRAHSREMLARIVIQLEIAFVGVGGAS